MRKFLLPLSILFTLTSCASFAGLGGKAHYVQTFEDIEAATVSDTGAVVPGQSTKYSLDIKGPAGMKWEEITSMSYKWNQTDGFIGVNSASKGDTLATAEAIKAVVPALTESIGGAVSSAVVTGINAAAPLIGQSLQIKGANDAAKDAAKAANVSKAIDVIGAAVPTPTTPSIVTPPVVAEPPVLVVPSTEEPPLVPPVAPSR